METKIKKFDKKNIVRHEETQNISLEKVGSFIEGYLIGVRPAVAKDGNPLIICEFFDYKQIEKRISCVASYKVVEFLRSTNFKNGYYLKIERTATLELDGGRKMGVFSFEYDEEGASKDLLSGIESTDFLLESFEEKGEVEKIEENVKKI